MPTQIATARQTATDYFPPVTSKATRTPRQQWNEGWQAFCLRQPFSLLTTQSEMDGYMAALNACAYADANAYLVSKGVVQ